ncbi:MAG: hypothetical protein CBD27_05560 [Rhodospirillaceae bacterium TMED167]|nr:hypothetical protein [Rhodospirillaceae bacterium]OUW27823.1 MAG: hypothetical protein CBD27_05560 [Rhodospirillaceae bacterium TMED167]
MDSERKDVREGITLMLRCGIPHLVVNAGDTPLKMHWVIFPRDQEDWIYGIRSTPHSGRADAHTL